MDNQYRYQHLIRPDCPLPAGTRVIAYCRDSGGEEQERSVAQQQQAMREYCDKHGLILERVYVDEARGGADAEKRGALNEMRADIAGRFAQIRNLNRRKTHMQKHPFGLLCWKSSRLGRDSLEATLNKADFRLRGLTIIPMTSAIETGDPAMNAMLESIQQLQDEKFLEQMSEDTRRGLSDVVTLRDNDPRFRKYNPEWTTNDGRYLSVYPGTPPTGFRGERVRIDVRERKGKRGGGEAHYVQRIVPDRESGLWERCQLAWEMRHNGEPIKRIYEATRLYKSVAGYSRFFQNRIYTGTLEYGGQILEHFVDALIPLDWWEAEQKRRGERSNKLQRRASDPLYEPRRVASRHLLTGLVFCGAVDGEEHPMNADTVPAREGKRSRWDFYICTHKKNTRDRQCQAPRVGAAQLDQAVTEQLLNILTADTLRPLAKELTQTLVEQNHDLNRRIRLLQADLNEVQKSIQQLVDAIEKIGLSTNIQARLQAREQEERQLIAQIVNLEDALVKPREMPKITEAQLEAWLAEMRGRLTGDDLELKRQTVRVLVGKIVVNQKAVTMYYTFPLSDISRERLMTPTGLEPVFWP